MRKLKIVVGVLFLSLLLGGCREKEEKQVEEVLQVSKDLFCYEVTEDVDCFTVDEEGMLYTTNAIFPEIDAVVATEFVFQPAVQTFCIYDLEGNCINQKEIACGNSSVYAMIVENDVLYCAVASLNTEKDEVSIYAVDVATWNVTELAILSGYASVRNMVKIGDYIYVLGRYEKKEQKDYILHPSVLYYMDRNEQVCRINTMEENSQKEMMNVDFPIGIYGTEKDTLIVYQYTEENGFGFLEYNPQESTLVEAGWKRTETPMDCISGCKDGYIFTKEGYMFYGTVDGMEAQIYPEPLSVSKSIVYKKGFAFIIDNEKNGTIERICVEGVVKENKVIKLLMHDSTMDKPYGCGFRMESDILPEEQLSLKVLAQDTDFDMFLLSTRKSCSYNLKQNGVFYPLNKVEGVMEYLDACFPYVKEMAINEEGDIWMIPVGLAIPGIVYNKEYCEAMEVDFSKMDLMEFLLFVEQMEEVEPEKTSISTLCVLEELFWQYLKAYNTFDTELFRSYLKKIKEIYSTQGMWLFDFSIMDSLKDNIVPESYFEYEVYSHNLCLYGEYLGTSEEVGVMGVPKLKENIENVGTVTCLAVNPQSGNLEATLEYISEFAQYMLTRKDSFLLKDVSMYTETPFIRECYELYAGGAVNFAMEDQVYWDTCNDYLKGTIGLEEAIAEMERRWKFYLGE